MGGQVSGNMSPAHLINDHARNSEKNEKNLRYSHPFVGDLQRSQYINAKPVHTTCVSVEELLDSVRTPE